MNNIQKISVILGVACLMAIFGLGVYDNGRWFIYEYSYLKNNEVKSYDEFHWMTIIPTCLFLLCGLTFYLFKDD